MTALEIDVAGKSTSPETDVALEQQIEPVRETAVVAAEPRGHRRLWIGIAAG